MYLIIFDYKVKCQQMWSDSQLIQLRKYCESVELYCFAQENLVERTVDVDAIFNLYLPIYSKVFFLFFFFLLCDVGFSKHQCFVNEMVSGVTYPMVL